MVKCPCHINIYIYIYKIGAPVIIYIMSDTKMDRISRLFANTLLYLSLISLIVET